MPHPVSGFTVKEKLFLEAYMKNGFDRAKAEKAAHYPKDSGYRVLARPEVQREIDARISTTFKDCAVMVAERLASRLRDKSLPDATLVKISSEVRQWTGQADPEAAKRAKDPSQMSAEELAAEIETLHHVAAARAKPIEDKTSEDGDVFG